MKGVRGITDADIEQELNYPAIHIDVDRTKAAYLGLAADDVIKNIITALNSSVLFSPNFWDDPVSGNNYFIGAMYPEQDIDSLETIANIPIQSNNPNLGGNGQVTLLRNVANLSNANSSCGSLSLQYSTRLRHSGERREPGYRQHRG